MTNGETEDIAVEIARWSDLLRHIAALGLRFTQDSYDRERYEVLRGLAVELQARAANVSLERYEPVRETVFSRPGPIVAGAGAVIDDVGKVLLMKRSDNGLWAVPGGLLEVGESPAAGVEREVLEETGYRCSTVALVGVYDTRYWETRAPNHSYKFTFLCDLVSPEPEVPSHSHETLEVGWFAEAEIPVEICEGHDKRITDAYRAWRGDTKAYFDPVE